MMNDALMQKQTKHTNTQRYLTDYVRRALLLFALVVASVGSAWGQITNVSTGAIDSQQKVADEYIPLKNNYPVDASSLIPSVESWTGDMVNNTTGNQHWNPAITGNYWEQTGADWSSSAGWTRSKSITVHLPKGSYVLIGACRASAQVAAYISVNGTQVSAPAKGSTGTGIATDGSASFEGGTYSNNNSGGGWEYRYIKFDVTNDGGADVPLGIGGTAPAVAQQWMSFTQPLLWKTVDDNVNQLIPYASIGSVSPDIVFNNEKAVNGTYTIRGSNFPGKADHRYIRFYLLDAVTETPVPIPAMTSSKGSTIHNYGTNGMSVTGEANFLDGNNFSLTLPEVRGRYKLMCYLSNYPCTQGVNNSTTYDIEPDITAAFEMDINHPFPGSLRSGGIKRIEVPLSIGTTSYTLTELGNDFNAITSGLTAKGTPLNTVTFNGATPAYALNQPTQQVYGDGSVGVNLYSDLSDYDKLVVTVTYGTPRFLFNRTEANGNCSDNEAESKMIEYPRGESSWVNRYFTREGNVFTVDLRKMVADKGYAHLHAIKGAYWQDVCVESMQLIGHKESLSSIPMYSWTGWDANAVQGTAFTGAYITGSSTGQPYGDSQVNAFADLSDCTKLVVTVTEGTPRFLFNRDVTEGQWNEDESQSHLIDNTKGGWSGKYFTQEGNTYIVDLEKMVQEKGYAHLHAIKGENSGNVTVSSMEVYKNSTPSPNVYARLFVANKNTGELAEQSALTVTPSGSDWTQKTVDGVNYGQVYYGSLSNLKAALSSITVSSSQPLYLGTNTLSLVVSSNLTRMIPNPASSAGDINVEPNWEKQYLVEFYKNDNYINELKDDGTVVRKAIPLADDNDISHALTNIYYDFDNILASLPASEKIYARIFVSDDQGNTLDDQSFLFNYVQNQWVKKDEYGWVFYGDRATFERVNLTFNSSPATILSTGALVGLAVSSDMSQLLPASPGSVGDIEKEPAWDVLYLYHFANAEERQYMNLPFRHYKGVTGRDWVKPEGSTGSMTQAIWTADPSYNNLLPTVEEEGDNHNSPLDGSAAPETVDVRQGVHTWEYNVYVTPSDGRRALVLPFENYMYGYQTGINNDGNDLEPRAYFRWYDWKTDRAVVNPDFTMTACNPNILKPYTETVGNETRDRGLVALNLDPDHPTQGRIGVWFEVGENFTEANYPNGLDIACDVSKYSDGIRVFSSIAYLEHEPTLSMRYIFHIHPASVIADTLKAAKENLGKARQLLENTSLTPAERLALYTNLEYYGIHHDGQDIEPMFNFPENRGRMVVSLGTGKKGNFSLRLDERSLDNYKLWDVNNEGQLVNADHVKWVAFYENEETGEVMRKQLVEPSTSFIQVFTYADFQGYFYPLGSTEASQHIENGMRFHVVGYVTSGEVNTLAGTGNFAPVAHYEVQFLVAPPLKVTDLRDNTDNVRTDNITRTDEYLAQNYDLKTVVDFDGNPETNKNLIKFPERKHSFYSSLDASPIPYTQLQDNKSWSDFPTYAANNMSWMPRQWGDIEYSYCYPQLCPYVINTNPNNSYWQYNHFLSPNHGDYMILKTMNLANISTQRTEPYLLQFWDGTELHDYTYVYNHNTKSGSFLYTDASNESRTMITIPFEADLCGGSSIYFTAAVADMTDAQIKPQLLVRVVGIGANGERVRVVSFHTCDIFTAADDPHSGQWYQVYGESTIPANFDDGIVDFVCEVVNYADNTNGADFAIDHFQLYTNTAKVKLSQDQGDCDDPASNKMFIYADAEGIQALYGKTGTTKIYWRIHDEHGEVVTAPGMYNDSDTEGTGIYGEIEIPLDYTKNNAVHTEAEVKANDNLYWFMGDDHKVYCKIAYRYMPGLMDGQTYYVSVYDPARQRSEVGFRPENNAYWGGLNTAARSKCSVFSPFFIPRQQFVIYYKEGVDGQAEGGHITMSCHGEPVVTDMKMMLKKPDIEQPSGFTNITDKIHFDYFFGTIQQWNSTNAAETFTYNNVQYTYKDVKEAWNEYRVSDSFYSAVGPTVRTDFNVELASGKDARTVLQAAVDAGLLALDYSFNFSNNFNTRPAKNYTVVCLPIEDKIPGTDPAVSICSPFVVKFDIVWPSPEMELGFADVEYPQREGMHRVVRIGLEQLNNLRNNGYKLHVPVHDYKNKLKNVNVGTLYFQSDMLTVSAVSNEQQEVAATNDPIGPAVGANFAKLLTPNGSSTHGNTPFVDADHMFLVLDLSGDNCQINFHEGYSYEVSTSFFDQADAIEDACFEDLYLTIKVVPEFVTWDPQKLGTQTTEGIDYYNVNWNNDNNWNRSERDELYKGAVTDAATATNHATGAHPNGYKNDTEIDSRLSSSNAFVPMKFTYVTLPEACRAPSLINMELQAYNTSPYTGGALLAGNLITDPSPYDPARVVNSPATPDIVYDILVRYSETECQGHLKNDKSSVYYLRHDNKVYDCEKFYGNICKEIYFKPRAELINQQRLTYERAWVEKELMPNQWYLMSAPLKATYAGDMYVPKADGRQTTEAFQPITFNTTNYSRTTYPFYQHSWDHGTGVNGSTVYKESSNYTADLPYTGAVTSTFAQWSHAFNDVQVPYSEMQGFAIHTKQAGSGSGNALLRLPKADTSWDYYNYNDERGSLNQGVTKGNLKYGRFLTDGADGKLINNNAQMTKSLVQPNANTDNRYYLVGNPYMASLNMAKFFEANTHLEPEWWAINGDPAVGEATGRVRPMEAFFVKIKESSSSATPVNFNKDMMVDGNDGTVQSGSRRPRLQLKATKDGVTTTAIVELNDSATNDFVDSEDVETLFDSNLADVPMVYTVASDGMALSINQLPEIVTVPFGVTCSSDEQVEVTVDLSPLTTHPSPIFVYDAQTGMTRAISDGETISIQPNDYGRYYLTTNEKIGSKEQNVDNDIVISVRQGGVVTVSAQGQLSLVRAVSVGGATAYEQTDCGTTTEFRLQQGTYVIETAGDAGRRTVKIQVR